MRGRRSVQVAIWLLVVIGGLTIMGVQVEDQYRISRAVTSARAAEVQQQLNNQLASDTRILIRRSGIAGIPTVQQLATLFARSGISISASADPPLPSDPAEFQRYRISSTNPPSQAWILLSPTTWGYDTGRIPIPPVPSPRDFGAMRETIVASCVFLWIVTCFAWLAFSRTRPLQLAEVLTGISLLGTLSYTGEWNSWASFPHEVCELLFFLAFSVVLLIYSWQAERGVAGRHCGSCGYDLWANDSGRCPECGAEVTAAQKFYLFAMLEDSREGRAESR